jgi:hypothetical protein
MEVLPRVYHPVIPCMNISRALGYVLLVTMARCVWTALRIQLCFLSSCKHYRLHQLWPTAPPSNWPLNKMPSLPLCSSRMLGLKISPILYGLFIRDWRINSTSLAFPSPRQKTLDLTSDASRDSQAEPPAQMQVPPQNPYLSLSITEQTSSVVVVNSKIIPGPTSELYYFIPPSIALVASLITK